MSKSSLWKTICLLCVFCAATAIGSPAQTFTTLVNFDGTNGAVPLYLSLVQGTDGNLYGTTYEDGANGYGTVFEITAGGKLTTLHSFCAKTSCTDGANPTAGLVQATDGNFYGTTYEGGASSSCPDGCGTIFKMTPGGKLTTMHSFDSTDGALPQAGLVQANNGNFYGTTSGGGNNICPQGCGTIFKITPGATLTTLYEFCSQADCTDGQEPLAPLVQATDGNLYGTTREGGASNDGTVFKITPSGALTTLHSFDFTDGYLPYAGLVQASDGNFYGTTFEGGAEGGGTVFKITPAGTLTTLHSFPSGFEGSDGVLPYAGLVQATDGNFYGTNTEGGYYNDGTIFKITTEGTLTTLFSFDLTDGYQPYATLAQATNGSLYGATSGGGANDAGTVFSLSVGLAPFVETRPTSGKVGAAVIILGTNLTGATSVTFNGTPATPFTVNSTGTAITTTVPSGATTGKVKVVTPKRTLSSNVRFRVVP